MGRGGDGSWLSRMKRDVIVHAEWNSRWKVSPRNYQQMGNKHKNFTQEETFLVKENKYKTFTVKGNQLTGNLRTLQTKLCKT